MRRGMVVIGAAAAMATAASGCSDGDAPARTLSATTDGVAYAAETPDAAVDEIPQFAGVVAGASGSRAGYHAYPVGSDPLHPAFLVRVDDGSTCLVVEGDDGVGTACRAPGAPIEHGVIGVGETRADGTYVSTLLVPDGVTAVRAAGRTVRPRRNLVRFTLPAGRRMVTVTTADDDFLLDDGVGR